MPRLLGPGLLALLAAVPLAGSIAEIHNRLPAQPERAVLLVAGLFVMVLVAPAATYLLVQRRKADPSILGLILVGTIGVLLTAIYFYWVAFYVLFPADILTWSESDFVNDILKLRVGYPIYTDQLNNESFNYTPGAQILTYALAAIFGHASSIPAYRFIQLGYTLAAAIIALFCCRTLIEMRGVPWRTAYSRLWGAVLLPIFFLIATNPVTNPFVHNLHDDALAQLVSICAYWLSLQYTRTGDRRFAIPMAIIPSVGFFVKQSLAVWAVLYCAQLAIFDRPRSIKRFLFFAFASFACLGLLLVSCYLIWGGPFFYWTITSLGAHGVSPLRSFQHMLDAWPYWCVGLVSGLVLLRGRNAHLLLSPWLIGLAFFGVETYTSGVAWMRNHMGPGSLIMGIWFAAAVYRIWPTATIVGNLRPHFQNWLRTGIAVTAIALTFGGMGFVRIPLRPFSRDAYRYVDDIEKEFRNESSERVLLDVGTWIYVNDHTIMKDRAPGIGERGYSGTGDFSGILQRLQQKHYSKILVRQLHSKDFWYDHYLWRRPGQIRRTLLENYQEIGRIQAVKSDLELTGAEQTPYLFSDISILVPKS